VGNLKGYDDGTTTGTYDYDENHRKVTETVDYGAFNLTNTYAYYANGLKKTYTGPDSIPYGYTYDTNNQLTGVSIPGQGMITISAYNWTRPASMTLPGGATKSYVYDPLMRVKQITSRDPGGNAVVDYDYTYDWVDNITAKNTEHGGYGYQYDDLYRLKDVDNPAAAADEAFTYDGVGNRLTAADTTGNWSYNQNNELGVFDTTSYEYDVNGNMTKKSVDGSVTSYVYNTEDRLAEVWSGEAGSGSLIAAYYYDPFGRRLWKEVGDVRTYFHYADEGLVGEYDAGGNEIKTYGYKPGSTWTTDPLFMEVGSEHYFYHNDHLGTPQKMTAVNGAIVWSAKYEGFGKAVVEVGTVVNNLRFPGQYQDQETGLHYNYHRYYDPAIGRYLRTDPIKLEGGINMF
jgi:RHS repeat-associated protein